MCLPRKKGSTLIQEQTVFIYRSIVTVESPLLATLFEIAQ